MPQVNERIGVALIGSLLIVGLCYFASQNETPKHAAVAAAPAAQVAASPTPMSDDRQVLPRLRQLAHQTNGDWSRLSEPDRRLLDGYTGGHGRAMFAMMAREGQGASASSKKKP